MKIIVILCLSLFSGMALQAQTLNIYHKSHSGTVNTFNLTDFTLGNFGLPSENVIFRDGKMTYIQDSGRQGKPIDQPKRLTVDTSAAPVVLPQPAKTEETVKEKRKKEKQKPVHPKPKQRGKAPKTSAYINAVELTPQPVQADNSRFIGLAVLLAMVVFPGVCVLSASRMK
jgi:hypothetical protein